MTYTNSSGGNSSESDARSRFLKDRIVFIDQEISDDITNMVVAKLLYLDSEDPLKDIYLHINSPGGSISCGLAIFDTIAHIRSDISTICVGIGLWTFLDLLQLKFTQSLTIGE